MNQYLQDRRGLLTTRLKNDFVGRERGVLSYVLHFNGRIKHIRRDPLPKLTPKRRSRLQLAEIIQYSTSTQTASRSEPLVGISKRIAVSPRRLWQQWADETAK
jgi:hypothetical protein